MKIKEISEVKPEDNIIDKIFVLREEKVMLDIHLAEIYGVETRALKQAVRRNLDLFPTDFMFVLSPEEIEIIIEQNIIPSKQHLGGSEPFAFTETGVAMLSSVLKSKRAREMNIAIIRAFVSLRKMVINHSELRSLIEKIEQKTDGNTKSIELLFEYIDGLMIQDEVKNEKIEIRKIGFKTRHG
ncbi:MAG: ORF6N domain-containing protein [Crocinitomicaceae bacterium]|nr:ORF6N domain-containing protein [Crocinitomicaceae bacterium]